MLYLGASLMLKITRSGLFLQNAWLEGHTSLNIAMSRFIALVKIDASCTVEFWPMRYILFLLFSWKSMMMINVNEIQIDILMMMMVFRGHWVGQQLRLSLLIGQSQGLHDAVSAGSLIAHFIRKWSAFTNGKV